MRGALKEARRAFDDDEIPVGALIVDPHGRIISRAHNEVETLKDPTAHAEIIAIRKAANFLRNSRLLDCILITTLEPCPMCAYAILNSKLSGVVYGASDLLSGAISSMPDLSLQSESFMKVWYMNGICAEESAALLNSFFFKKRLNHLSLKKHA